MNSYKIKIKSQEESIKVQEHAVKLGYRWGGFTSNFTKKYGHSFFLYENGSMTYYPEDASENAKPSNFYNGHTNEEISVKDFLKLSEFDSPKVYCGKCKYFSTEYFKTERTFCLHPTNKKIISTWLEESEVYEMLPEFLNKNNDCKNYEIGVKYENNK